MKKAFLLFAAGTIAIAANAQEAMKSSVVFNNSNKTANQTASVTPTINGKKLTDLNAFGEKSALKTTTVGGGRWYSYGNYLAQNLGSGNWTTTTMALWNDTTAQIVYSDGTHQYNPWTSIGMSLDPFFTGFNDPTYYPGAMVVTSSDAYTVDSIAIVGVYVRSSADGATSDNVKFGLVYGDGTNASNLPGYYFTNMTTNYGIDTLNFLEMMHDSTNNTSAENNATYGGTSTTMPVIASGVLTPADSSSMYYLVKAFPVSLVVPPGNFAATALSYKNGSVTGPLASTDTLQHYNGAVNHDEFYPLVFFKGDSATSTPAFPPYSISNQNNGYFKPEGAMDANWGGYYIPNWAWKGSTGGASWLQFPEIEFHVHCNTCLFLGVSDVNKNTISGVKAYPNPANEVVTIAYNFSNSTNATIVLTNMVGQEVASSKLTNVTEGTATINVTSVPAGMYLYTVLSANGQRATGRIVVAH